MTRRLTATLATLTISACLMGCVNRARFPAYYTLHVPPAIDVPIAGGPRPSLAVREFRSPAYLRQGAIVYRISPEQVGFYQYHRWAGDPREFVTNAIIDRLRATGRFAEVRAYDGRSDVDFVLNGRLEKIEEVDRYVEKSDDELSDLREAAEDVRAAYSPRGTVAPRSSARRCRVSLL